MSVEDRTKTNEKVSIRSRRYFFLTPSETARELLYYITRCGHYLCSSQYEFSGSTLWAVIRHARRC